MSKSLNHWVFSAPSHTKFLRQYTKYSLADILVLRERKILQAFCGLESSEISPKIQGLHKVQSALACRLQVRNSRSNLQGLGLRKNNTTSLTNTLKDNPKEIRMRFSRMKHAISEKLYFVYYLRNGVLSSERSPKIRGFKDSRIINLPCTLPPLRLNLSCFHECHLCKGRADQFIYKYGKQNNVTDYFSFV